MCSRIQNERAVVFVEINQNKISTIHYLKHTNNETNILGFTYLSTIFNNSFSFDCVRYLKGKKRTRIGMINFQKIIHYQKLFFSPLHLELDLKPVCSPKL